jgi:dynein assembly factor 2
MIPPQPNQQGSDLKLDGLTREEVKRIEKSMKKPEFMGLLNEYMVEISDPKNKAEYDEYLRQMEKDGELPKHMKLIKLTPEFCLRTVIVSSRNKTHEMKFFVNMCSTTYIEKPSCEAGNDGSGGVGYNWKVPNSIGKIRYDQDKCSLYLT